MNRPPRDDAFWADYEACLDEGWSSCAAIQHAEDDLEERVAEAAAELARYEADCSEESLTECQPDTLRNAA